MAKSKKGYYWVINFRDSSEIIEQGRRFSSPRRALQGARAFIKGILRRQHRDDAELLGPTVIQVFTKPNAKSEHPKLRPVSEVTIGREQTALLLEPKRGLDQVILLVKEGPVPTEALSSWSEDVKPDHYYPN